MTQKKIEKLDLKAMQHFAVQMASNLKTGDVILLSGDLGAGKTQFAKFLIRTLSEDPAIEVPSPTFTLVQTYDTNKGEIWHFDLYRLEEEYELEAIGLDDAFAHGISLIEWPDRLGTHRPKSRLHIDIRIENDETRTVTITPHGPKWADRSII